MQISTLPNCQKYHEGPHPHQLTVVLAYACHALYCMQQQQL